MAENQEKAVNDKDEPYLSPLIARIPTKLMNRLKKHKTRTRKTIQQICKEALTSYLSNEK